MFKIMKLNLLFVLAVFAGMVLFPSFFELDSAQDLISAEPEIKVVKSFETIITGYSSTPDQTDLSPFITASNTQVRDGIVAANFLPIGTKIRLPELFGPKIFDVEDRMHPRKHYLIDVWFDNREDALAFGAQRTLVQVVEPLE